jgi:hypothetical protein
MAAMEAHYVMLQMGIFSLICFSIAFSTMGVALKRELEAAWQNRV